MKPAKHGRDHAPGGEDPIPSASSGVPFGYTVGIGAQTFTDGQDYALTGLDGMFVGTSNSEGVATSIEILNDPDSAFSVDEALQVHKWGLYVYDAGVEFANGAGFPAGRIATIYPETALMPAGAFVLGGVNKIETDVTLPTGAQTYTLRISGLALVNLSLSFNYAEFVISVMVTGGNVDINSGWAAVALLSDTGAVF